MDKKKTLRLQTSDLPLASYLYTAGATLVAVDRRSPNRCMFAFELSTDNQGALAQWQSGVATVNALAFWNSIQVLKRKLHGDEDDRTPFAIAR